MQTATELIEFLHQVPDIRVLLNCASRCGCRIGLRGGVVRHLLFSFQQIDPIPVSLYDFIDAFSDIDVVVDHGSDWPILQQAISGSLPFAGFHRWEVETLERVVAIAKSYVLFPVDRIIIWVDGRERDRPAIQVDGLLVDADSVISNPNLDPDLSRRFDPAPEPAMMALLTLLRFGRYYFQFPEHRGEISPETILKIPIAVTPGETAVRLNRRRVELAVLHVLFNARELTQAISFLDSVRRLIPKTWIETSKVLKILFGQQFGSANFIGAAVYKPGPLLPLRIRLLARNGAASASGGVNSVIPWTRLSSVGDPEEGCCRYRDFSAGPAVVAWRNAGAGPLSMELRDVENYGVVAVRLGPTAYSGSPSRGHLRAYEECTDITHTNIYDDPNVRRYIVKCIECY